MTRLYLTDAQIYQNGSLIRCDVGIENGRIAHLCYDGALSAGAERHSLKGCVLMAGLKNCHTHSAMTLLRGYAEGLTLKRWLFERVFPFEARLSEEDVYYGTRLAILEYLAGGTVDICEMYLHDDAFMRAAVDCGFKVMGVGAVSDLGDQTVADKKLERCEALYQRYKGEAQRYSYGFHAEYTCSEYLLRQVAALAGSKKAPVFAHMSETQDEVEGCMARRGKTPLEYCDSLGLFDYGGTIFHAVHLTDREIQIAREKKLNIVLNIGSNLKLASGLAPIKKMLDAGLSLAVGTDGAASNNALDLFNEMRLISTVGKVQSGDASAVTAEQALKILIDGGARVLGGGKIAVGEPADLTAVSTQSPRMHPFELSSLVYSASASDVALTMIDGRILYSRGRFYLNMPASYIYKKCDSIVKRIKKQLK